VYVTARVRPEQRGHEGLELVRSLLRDTQMKIMVGVLNCSTNTYGVKVGLMSCKRTAMVGIRVPNFLSRRCSVFQRDGLLWLPGIGLVVVVLQGLAKCSMP
jgi:hypothetical protein